MSKRRDKYHNHPRPFCGEDCPAYGNAFARHDKRYIVTPDPHTEPRTDYDDPALYPFDEGMKAQCKYIIWWQQCRLDAGHDGMHSPGRASTGADAAARHHNHDGCNPYDEAHIAGKADAAAHSSEGPTITREQVHIDPDTDPVDAFIGGFRNGWHSARLAPSSEAVEARLDPEHTEAVRLLDEVYAHVGEDGQHLPGPEVKIWVHRSTIDRIGDFLAGARDRLATASPREGDERE